MYRLLKIHCTRSELRCFTLGFSSLFYFIIAKPPTLLVEKEPIETEDSHRVLGVVIDNDLI